MRKKYLITLAGILLFSFLSGQNKKGLVARFSFNDLKDYEELGKRKVKLVGANYTVDRFGNPNNAIYLAGNPDSYINLGSYAALKPKRGTVSLWLMVELETASGKGGMVNAVILTKNADSEDYFESYCIYYLLESNRIEAVGSRDSLKQTSVYSMNEFPRFKWQHLAISYDHNFLSFYINGKLEGKCTKNYETEFNPLDSVVVGTTASIKNQRSLNGIVDDIEIYDRVLTDKEILELYNAPNPNKNTIIINWILLFFGIVTAIVLIYLFTRYRLSLMHQKEKKRLELYNMVLETELRVNRALMNPHFVFNSLNALQNFILKNENARANNYLVKFSKLMRRILESNMSDVITLEFEVQLLKSYLEIEDLRFEENIKYSVTVDPEISPSTIQIPIMMIQPFVENAIWHGLLKKHGEKLLSVTFSVKENKYVLCTIEDNGSGRKKSGDSLNLEKSSLATGFIEQRLSLLNQMHHLNCSLSIEDKPENTGTIVRILLPILKNKV